MIKYCTTCNKPLDRRNKSGYCRSCNMKLAQKQVDYSSRKIDYSSRKIDYSARKIDYSSRKIDYSARNINYDRIEALYDKKVDDFILLQKIVKSMYNVYLARKDENDAQGFFFWSHDKYSSKYSKKLLSRSLKLLKESGLIEHNGLEKKFDYDFECNTYKIKDMVSVRTMAISDIDVSISEYATYYFGTPTMKNTQAVANLTDSQKRIVESFIQYGYDPIESKRKLSPNSVMRDIEGFCNASKKFKITVPMFLDSLAIAVEYATVNNCEISYHPNYKESKHAYGIRFYNDACRTQNEEHSATARRDYLREHGIENAYHYDVHSSIPNIINFVKTGRWNDIDWHSKIAKECGVHRDFVKYFALACCFAANNYNTQRVYKNFSYHLKKNDERAKIFFDLMRKHNKKVEHFEVKKIIEVSLKYYKTQGCRNLFFVESDLYLRTWKKLHDRGIKCVMVYDSFYTDKQVDIESVIKESASEMQYYY